MLSDPDTMQQDSLSKSNNVEHSDATTVQDTEGEPQHDSARTHPTQWTHAEYINYRTHVVFGHMPWREMVEQHRHGGIPSSMIRVTARLPFCEGCAVAKQRRRANRIASNSLDTLQPTDTGEELCIDIMILSQPAIDAFEVEMAERATAPMY